MTRHSKTLSLTARIVGMRTASAAKGASAELAGQPGTPHPRAPYLRALELLTQQPETPSVSPYLLRRKRDLWEVLLQRRIEDPILWEMALRQLDWQPARPTNPASTDVEPHRRAASIAA